MRCWPFRTTVHPRSRGEHPLLSFGTCTTAGSSPLARGTHGRRAARGRGRRFIPARAGNTRSARGHTYTCPVHPRSRGEHCLRTEIQPSPTGSSPLARGTPADTEQARQARRFIPARAGNTQPAATARPHPPVHPRSRGEHTVNLAVPETVSGSSPLARGTPSNRCGPSDVLRFIPARAGNTRPRPASPAAPPVHPRSRGEHFRRYFRHHPPDGSSPLARGTLHLPVPVAAIQRFIPARAGNTLPRSREARSLPVHPRSRGEHPRAARTSAGGGGSSPLARGTPVRRPRRAGAGRFIPARAGNTLESTDQS